METREEILKNRRFLRVRKFIEFSKVIAEINKIEDFPGNIAEHAIDNPQLIPVIINRAFLEIEMVNLDSMNLLLIISRKDPKILYPYLDFFIKLLDSDNGIIMRYVIEIITNLSAVDSENKFQGVFDKLYGLLFDGSIVTAAYIIDNSWKIVKNKPCLQKKVINELLKLENAPRYEKHKNILLGKVILSFDKCFDEIENKDEISLFVKRQLKNPRNATHVKAKRFLRKHSI